MDKGWRERAYLGKTSAVSLSFQLLLLPLNHHFIFILFCLCGDQSFAKEFDPGTLELETADNLFAFCIALRGIYHNLHSNSSSLREKLKTLASKRCPGHISKL